jgi:hypothetical protein
MLPSKRALAIPGFADSVMPQPQWHYATTDPVPKTHACTSGLPLSAIVYEREAVAIIDLGRDCERDVTTADPWRFESQLARYREQRAGRMVLRPY